MTDKITISKGKDKTVVDAKTQTMRCTACGDEVPIPLGVVAWVSDVMQAFSKVHRGCTHEPGRTRFSVPDTSLSIPGGEPGYTLGDCSLPLPYRYEKWHILGEYCPNCGGGPLRGNVDGKWCPTCDYKTENTPICDKTKETK